MKKLFKYLILFILVISLLGCKKKEEEIVLADDEVILENIMYKLDQDDNGYDLKYKIASNFRRSNMINAINYFSEKIDDRSYFVIRILQYKNKDINYAIKDSTENKYLSKEEVKVGDLNYTKVRFKNPIGEETYTNIYYYRNKKDTYAFVFTAVIDLSRLENIFLTQIEY